MEQRTVNILGALPPSATQFYQIKAILTAVNRELNRVSGTIAQTQADLFLLHAQTRLHLWERDLGIREGQDGDNLFRRRTILAKAKLMGTQTQESLEKGLRTYLQQEELSVAYDNRQYRFYATIHSRGHALSTVSDMVQFLRITLPAHIAVTMTAASHLDSHSVENTLYSGQYTTIIPIGG